MSHHGAPCWYELSTADSAASQAFYGPILGWSFQDAGMPDFSYTLAVAGGDMVAGLMEPDSPMPEFWLVYFAVDDCDAAAEKAKALGGSLHRGPEDIPGTGRFASGSGVSHIAETRTAATSARRSTATTSVSG